MLVDTLDADVGHSGNSDDLATIPIGMAAEPSVLAFAPASGILAGDDALVGQVVAERYRIEEVVGRGGMGVVYRARHLLLDKTVAVKLLRPQYVTDERAVARFLREARAMARIAHANAVHVYDFGVLPGGAFLVMEFIEGDSLRMLLMQRAPLPLEEAVVVTEQVCAAVQAAHEQGVLHRDLKPENIMIRNGDEPPLVKVVDFGLAKIVSGTEDEDGHKSITSTNELFGTPCYMAPEFFEGTEVDARSDVYAIGIILYEMLAGAPPFRGTMQTVIGAHLFKEAPPITVVNGEVPRAIDALLRQTLRKDRTERPTSAAELASHLREAFEAHLAGEELDLSDIALAPRSDEEELRLDNMPTLAPVPEKLRLEALAASPTVETAEPSAIEADDEETQQPADSGALEPTEPVPLTEMAPSATMGWRAYVVRASVAVGSAAILVLAFVSFNLTASTPRADSEIVAPPFAAQPAPTEAETPAVEVSDPDADVDRRSASGVSSTTAGRPDGAANTVDAGSRAANPDGRSAGARTAGTSDADSEPKLRPAEPTDEKAKPKPAAQPAKDEKKTRKRAWYDPRRWFGKS